MSDSKWAPRPSESVASSRGPAAGPSTVAAAPLSPHAAAVARKRQADERVLAESGQLITQARMLDNRLNVATQTDRQLARRAAGLVTQLARRLSVLLSRTVSLLPMLPGHGGRRVSHYVVHAERVDSGSAVQRTQVRMLTIGSNGMLRVGSTDSDVSAIVWAEYDPFAPAPGWDLETVIERLATVVVRVEGHVDAVESRVQARARTLDTLAVRASRKGAAPAAPAPSRHPVAPLLSLSHSASAKPNGLPGGRHASDARADAPVSAELQEELDRAMEREMELAMEQELDDAISAQVDQIFPTAATTAITPAHVAAPPSEPAAAHTTAPAPEIEPPQVPVPGSLEDATARYERSRHKRQLFDRIK